MSITGNSNAEMEIPWPEFRPSGYVPLDSNTNTGHSVLREKKSICTKIDCIITISYHTISILSHFKEEI